MRNVTRPRQVERALDDEVDGYLEPLVEEKIAGGMPPGAARRAALVELGGVAQVKDEVRARGSGRA